MERRYKIIGNAAGFALSITPAVAGGAVGFATGAGLDNVSTEQNLRASNKTYAACAEQLRDMADSEGLLTTSIAGLEGARDCDTLYHSIPGSETGGTLTNPNTAVSGITDLFRDQINGMTVTIGSSDAEAFDQIKDETIAVEMVYVDQAVAEAKQRVNNPNDVGSLFLRSSGAVAVGALSAFILNGSGLILDAKNNLERRLKKRVEEKVSRSHNTNDLER